MTYCKDEWDASLSVHILLLHHYKSDLAHISDFDSLVIGLSKSERWAKNIKKWMTSSICMKFAHFWVVLVRKCMVQKFLISYCFDFLDRFVFRDFLMIPYELFRSFCSELNGQKCDLLKLCLKKKRKINEFFPDTTSTDHCEKARTESSKNREKKTIQKIETVRY